MAAKTPPLEDGAQRGGCLGALTAPISLFRSIVRQAARSLTVLPYEYTSSQRLLGWPVLCVNVGLDTPEGKIRHAKGWLAIGNQATGVVALALVAGRGGIVVAPFALGVGAIGVAGLGVVSVSVLGMGLVSVSAFAFGALAVGIVSVGLRAIGIVAIGASAVGIIALGEAVKAVFR